MKFSTMMFAWGRERGTSVLNGVLLLLMGVLLQGCPKPLFNVEFYASSTVGNAPMSVVFYDATNTNGQEIKSWLWEFGDGGNSNEPSPTHVYTLPGKYTVTLILETSKGPNALTIPNYITVRGKFRVLVRNTGGYPMTAFYLTPADSPGFGANRILHDIPPGGETDLGREYQQDGYLIAAVFDVDGFLDSVQYVESPGYYSTIGMTAEYLVVEAWRLENGEKGLTAAPLTETEP